MAAASNTNEHESLTLGAVSYLNSQPLVDALPRLAPSAEIVVDFPSRLADALAAGKLDVALVPSIEYFGHDGWTIVSDACIACDGPVRSVKLFGRVPLGEIRTLALDEGSRTSAALVQILLRERFNIEPKLRRLPMGDSPDDTDADAVMLIGDRAMQMSPPGFESVWDLGQVWSQWTGLPFVFAMWVARPGVPLAGVVDLLAAARDEGVRHLAEIARREAPRLNVPQSECLAYLRDHLIFRLGRRERQGLERFARLAARHQLAPTGAQLVFAD